MVRSIFAGFYSKRRGPPTLRMQVVGISRRRFYKIVAANVHDPPRGKHMEVLGSYVPRTGTPVKELRLRFSRIKFWLGAGAQANHGLMRLLGYSELIPSPPPVFGRRTCGQEAQLQQIVEENVEKRGHLIRQWLKSGKRFEVEYDTETNEEGVEVTKKRTDRYFIADLKRLIDEVNSLHLQQIIGTTMHSSKSNGKGNCVLFASQAADEYERECLIMTSAAKKPKLDLTINGSLVESTALDPDSLFSYDSCHPADAHNGIQRRSSIASSKCSTRAPESVPSSKEKVVPPEQPGMSKQTAAAIKKPLPCPITMALMQPP